MTRWCSEGVGAWGWGPSREGGTLEGVERGDIEHPAPLRMAHQRSGNAAEVLGLHPNTLRFRMKKLGIRRPAAPATVHGLKRLLA